MNVSWAARSCVMDPSDAEGATSENPENPPRIATRHEPINLDDSKQSQIREASSIDHRFSPYRQTTPTT